MRYSLFLLLLISFNVFSKNFLNDDAHPDLINIDRSEDVLKLCLEYGNIERVDCFEPRLFFSPEQTEVYSIENQEIIIHGSCCGRQKDTNIDYYKYISSINNWVLYKAISSSHIGPEYSMKNNFLYFNDEVTKINYLSGNQTLGGKILSGGHINAEGVKSEINKKLREKYVFWLSSYRNKEPFLIDEGLIQIAEWLYVSELSNDTVEMYNNIGYFLLEKNKYIQSIYLLEKIVQKFPDRIVAKLNLADALYKFGQIEQSAPLYKAYYQKMKSTKQLKKVPSYVKDRMRTP